MKKVLAFSILITMMSSCGYRLGSHGSKINVPAWKAESEAKKEAKKEKTSEKPNTPEVQQIGRSFS